MRTNVDFLLWATAEEGFRDGSYDTHYIENHFDVGCLHNADRDLDLAAIAGAIAAFQHHTSVQYRSASRGDGARDAWGEAARRDHLRRKTWWDR